MRIKSNVGYALHMVPYTAVEFWGQRVQLAKPSPLSTWAVNQLIKGAAATVAGVA